MTAPAREGQDTGRKFEVGGAYAHFVLLVLVVVYAVNFIDRQILSILSHEIQRDLGVGDAPMGFLYGTVFAVFYAAFGIPLARLSDVWIRRNVIAIGLAFWSVMTALSGFAGSYATLALFRIGVGIGEASASPAAYSMLCDYYSTRRRATVLAIYSGGLTVGGGIGLLIGGYILEAWNGLYPVSAVAPLGLKGWQAAFLIVGLPGLLLALIVSRLREPPRGAGEGAPAAPSQPAVSPLRVLATELSTVVPVLNLVVLHRLGASLRFNLACAAVLALCAAGLSALVGETEQWVALGAGIYVAISWTQALRARDAATFHLIFRTPSLICVLIAFPTISLVTYGINFWTAPYLLRAHGASVAQTGLYIGVGNIVSGLIAVPLGGLVADHLKERHPCGRLILGFVAVFCGAPLMLWMLYTPSLMLAFALNFIHHLFSACWSGVVPSTAADLVLPRMRAVVGAVYLFANTMIGLALGPFLVGKLSDGFVAGGMAPADALRTAMACALPLLAITVICLILAWRTLPRDEASKFERAAACDAAHAAI